MTTKQAVSVERHGRVAIVRFDRGERLNAMSPGLIGDLTDAARSFEDDLDASVIVVTGTQDYFSSGADLKDNTYLDPERSALERRHLIQAGGRLAALWEALPQVTIAAISGPAVGAGCAFALASDWRVMDRDAYFFLPEVKLGLNLQWNAVPRLVSLVGPALAKRMILLCEKVTAPDLLHWGAIDRMADAKGGSVELALEWAGVLAGYDPLTLRMMKQAVTSVSSALTKGLSYADADQTMLTALLNPGDRTVPAGRRR
jgi:enoyl-CoA hydratase